MFGSFMSRKREVFDIDTGSPAYDNMELYAIFVPPRQRLRKRRRITPRNRPSTPTSPPHIHRSTGRRLSEIFGKTLWGAGNKHTIETPTLSFESERDCASGTNQAHEVMRALFQRMKKTEKSRSQLLLLQRDTLPKEMLEHNDKLLHQNTTRKKLIRSFREELGTALLDKLNRPKEIEKGSESPCSSSSGRSPDNSPSRVSHSSSSTHHHLTPYDSPSQISHDGSTRKHSSPYSSPDRLHRVPSQYRTSPYTSPTQGPSNHGTSPYTSPSRNSPSRDSPSRHSRTPPYSSPSRVAQYASRRRTAYNSPPRHGSGSPQWRGRPSPYHSPDHSTLYGEWNHQTTPKYSPSRVSCASLSSTSPSSAHHSHSPSSLKGPNRVSPYKSPSRVTFALELPHHPDSPNHQESPKPAHGNDPPAPGTANSAPAAPASPDSC